MPRLNIHRMSYLPIAALILSGSSMLAGPGVSAVGPPVAQPETARSSIEATRLLEEVRSISNQLNREVQTLESFSRNGVSWEGHAYQLTLAKDHINAIGDRLETLQAIRSTAAPWQQQAIDSLVPVAVQLASRTETAINHLNENRRQLFNPVYTDHLTSIADHADELRDSVAVSLEVANTQDKLDTLRERAAELQS